MPDDPFAAAARLEGVPSAFAATRDGIDSVLRDRGLRRSSPASTTESLLLGAAATAALQGSAYDVDELRRGGGDVTARAAVRLSSELLGLAPVWVRSPLQVLARIHTLAASAAVPSDELGRPVDPVGAQRLTALAARLALPTQAPGLVVAALVHAEVAAAGAFVAANDVVARAAERLVLVVTGVDPAGVTVPEAGHAARPQAYRQALDGYASGGEDGAHRWLLYAAQAFALGAEATPLAPPAHRGAAPPA